MKFLDLFAGVGGIRLGMEQAGHSCVGWVEWDKFARKSYIAIHKPDGEFTEKDINDVTSQELPKADSWCFGFPCQDISVAGKQGGFTNGKRSSLFFKVTGLIRELKEEDKPSYLFIENVKNLLSINKGWDFAKLLIEMDEIGYDVEWDVLDSSEVVPQHRERIFIVGHLRGRNTRKVFPIIRKDGETDKPDKSVNQIGNISNSKSFGGNPQVGRVYGTDGISPTLSTMQGGGQEPKILDDQGRTKKILKPLSISPTLRSQSHGNEPKVLVSKYERTDYGKQVRKDYEAKKVKLHRSQVRNLTFKESSISNTLTTVQKDNMIAIPVLTPDRLKKRQNGRRFKTNGEPEFTLTGQDRHGVLINGNEPKVVVREATKTGYDVAQLGDSINFAQPNSKTRRGRVGHGVANTLTTTMEQATLIQETVTDNDSLETITNVSQGVKVEAKPAFGRLGQQAADTMNANEVSDFDIIEPFNHRVHKDQVSPTLTTRPEGLKTAILPVTNNLRIRKLTPRECWRLQGFPDWAFDRAREAGLSDSQLYKQAGNSVTVPVIYEIAKRLFIESGD